VTRVLMNIRRFFIAGLEVKFGARSFDTRFLMPLRLIRARPSLTIRFWAVRAKNAHSRHENEATGSLIAMLRACLTRNFPQTKKLHNNEGFARHVTSRRLAIEHSQIQATTAIHVLLSRRL